MTDNEILKKPKAELIMAEQAILRMAKSDRLEGVESEWKIVLGALERCWIKTERSCQAFRQKFEPWQSSFKQERKKDPLLRYLKHARNSDEHTLQESMQEEGARNTMSIPGGSGAIVIEKLEIQGGKLIEYRGNKPLVFEQLPNRIELVRVKDRSKWYNPPKTHLNAELAWPDPLLVSRLGHSYYFSYVDLVEKVFFSAAP